MSDEDNSAAELSLGRKLADKLWSAESYKKEHEKLLAQMKNFRHPNAQEYTLLI